MNRANNDLIPQMGRHFFCRKLAINALERLYPLQVQNNVQDIILEDVSGLNGDECKYFFLLEYIL
jgi:hypothetical protein